MILQIQHQLVMMALDLHTQRNVINQPCRVAHKHFTDLFPSSSIEALKHLKSIFHRIETLRLGLSEADS